MSSLTLFAEEELERIGMGKNSKDENKLMHDHIIHMVEEFSKEGHSGFSASYALGILTKLLDWKPLTPLTGEDSEWNDVSDLANGRQVFQNRRCSRVFKEQLEDGSFSTYDVNGKVFYPKGKRSQAYTNGNSRVPVTFPYTPTIEYVEVDEGDVSREN